MLTSDIYDLLLLPEVHDFRSSFAHVYGLLQRARQQRSEAKSKKVEAQHKNTKVQQISNPATIKKMMKDKKQRKKLMTADPEKAAKGHA